MQSALDKKSAALKDVDIECHLEDWSFRCNLEDIPKQTYTYDCGIYIYLYARCLAYLGPMLEESSFPE